MVNEEGRKFLTDQFRGMCLSVVPSAANFLLVDVGRPGGEMTDALLRRGVIVRPMGGYGFPTHLRITIGTAQENEKCVDALKAVLKQ
jgi:histidinol-phosphate aminotransferase